MKQTNKGRGNKAREGYGPKAKGPRRDGGPEKKKRTDGIFLVADGCGGGVRVLRKSRKDTE